MMSLYPPPEVIAASVWTEMPREFRRTGEVPEWAQANMAGRALDSFIEGPSFDRDGNLLITDIPYGRVFSVSPTGGWTLVCEYDGWPNGMKLHRDGRAFITDYKRGIMVLDIASGKIEPLLTHRHSESFRGVNDLFFDTDGKMYFTDQGQSGLHMPNGRVYRYDMQTDQLDLLIDTGPSPNGLVMNAASDVLYVAMTRANCVWRLPQMPNGDTSKVGLFVQLSGGFTGPDGLAMDAKDGLYIAHCGNGCVWGFDARGHPKVCVQSPGGLMTTNLAFGGAGNNELFITESARGSILRATVPEAGATMFAQT
jgi:gluconolactonase